MERITLIGECLNYPKERNKLIKYHIVSIYKELMNFGVVCYWLHNIIFHIVTQKTSTTSTIKKKKTSKFGFTNSFHIMLFTTYLFYVL